MSVSPNVKTTIMRSWAATMTAKEGNFEKLCELEPQRYMWASDEHRMVLMRGRRGSSVPHGVSYSANYLVIYDNIDKEFYVVKNRSGSMKHILRMLNECFQLTSFVERDGIICVDDEEDLTILRLKGIM